MNTIGTKYASMIGIAVCLCLAIDGLAQAYDFVWHGTFVHKWSASATFIPNYYGNGWGRMWYYTDDPAPYYPHLDESVLITAGSFCGSGNANSGDEPAYCGPLTIEADATLDRTYGHLYTSGPTVQNNGSDIAIGEHLGLYGNVELQGSGGYNLVEDGAIVGMNDYRDLTINPGVVIYGLGRIGIETPADSQYSLNVTNNGVIRATPHISRRLSVWAPSPTRIINNNLMEAAADDGTRGRASLVLRGNYDNRGGVIRANEGGHVLLSGGSGIIDTHITGGVLQSVGKGVIEVTGRPSLIIEDVQVDGTLRVITTATPTVKTAMSVLADGVFQVGPDDYGFSGSGSEAQIVNNFSLGGQGQTLVGCESSLLAPSGLDAAPTLTIEAGHTLRMIECSNLGYSDGGVRSPVIINRGTIAFDPIVADYTTRASIWAHNGFTNEGRFYVADSAEAEDGVCVYRHFSQTDGQLISDSYLQFQDCGAVTITGGTVGGTGIFSMNSSWFEIGADATLTPCASTGTMTVSGDMTLKSGADAVYDISNVAEDRIVISGTLTIEGEINIRLQPCDLTGPRMLDLTLFESGSTAGQPTFNVSAPAGWTWSGVARIGNTYVLQDLSMITEPLVVEDLNRDGMVDFKDFAVIAWTWRMSCSEPGWCEGCDLDTNGVVDFADVRRVVQKWLWEE